MNTASSNMNSQNIANILDEITVEEAFEKIKQAKQETKGTSGISLVEKLQETFHEVDTANTSRVTNSCEKFLKEYRTKEGLARIRARKLFVQL